LAVVYAVQALIKKGEIKGEIRYYGCPAEELLLGKGFMAKAGAFEGVDVALTWHPGDISGVWTSNYQALVSYLFNFHGKTAHAAGDPFNGRSALDAVELMNVGANYLREHISTDARLHYVITNGGDAPNIVPDKAQVWYFIRAPTNKQVQEVLERLQKVAKGAAMMTETKVDSTFLSGSSNHCILTSLNELLDESLTEVANPVYSPEEHSFSLEIARSFSGDILVQIKQFIPAKDHHLIPDLAKTHLFSRDLSLGKENVVMGGSTDVGDVSWVVPTGQIFITTCALGTPGHSWQMTAQAGMGIGHKGLLYAGKVLAVAATKLFRSPESLTKITQEFTEKIEQNPYISPIPDGTPVNFEFFEHRQKLRQ
jgi:aminobenzoyl-glutamate utilization protein B